MTGKHITIMALALGLAGCLAGCQAPDNQPQPQTQPRIGPTPKAPASPIPAPSPTTALLGLDDGPVSENYIPLVMRGHWRRIGTTPGATKPCADAPPGNVVHIDRDTLETAGSSALLRSIDQISRDYLRATFEQRRGSHTIHYQRTLNVDDRGDRLTLRGKDDRGETFIDHYQRCSIPQR